MPNPASKQIIAVDIDDVLAEHIEAFVEYSNLHHGTKLTKSDYSEEWSTLWQVPTEEVERRAIAFQSSDAIGRFGVIKDAQSALNALKARWDLVIVTARRRHNIDMTHEWIERNFPDTFLDIHFVPIWEPDSKVTKAEICQRIGADYLIDDLVRHCNLAAEVGIKAILFSRAEWKQPEMIRSDVTVVKNWKQVLEYFENER